VDDVERALRDPAPTRAAAERARAAWEARHTSAAYTTALVDALAAVASVPA
jgi:hypothetical protein